jgi:HSP20 family molecular chaperone IbpA
MVRRFHRSVYDELDELRSSMDYLYQLALEPADNPMLPGEDSPDTLCQLMNTLKADVAEIDEDVIVTVNMIPGTGNTKFSVDLINEKTLKISYNREEMVAGDIEGNRPRRRRSISLHCIIPLPCPVMKRGAAMSLRNGVLDLRFRKAVKV